MTHHNDDRLQRCVICGDPIIPPQSDANACRPCILTETEYVSLESLQAAAETHERASQ